jgi:hypothetical protein
MAYDISKTIVNIIDETATVAFSHEDVTIEVTFRFQPVLSEGVRPARVVSEALQVLREAIKDIPPSGV